MRHINIYFDIYQLLKILPDACNDGGLGIQAYCAVAVLVRVSAKSLIVEGCCFLQTHPKQKSPPTALFLAVFFFFL